MRPWLGFAFACSLAADMAQGQERTAPQFPTLWSKPCGLPALPDSTFTLDAGAASLWSDGAATYAGKSGSCYTVDFKIPRDDPKSGLSRTVRIEAGARASGLGWITGGDFSIPDALELCGVYLPQQPPAYRQTTTVYRRRAREAEFRQVGSKITEGVWQYNACRLDLPHWALRLPVAGTDVYRIAVRVQIKGKYWVPVRVKATRLPLKELPPGFTGFEFLE
jgi:hypothetical protein